MKECKECGGTGVAINNKFCKCEAGKGRRSETLRMIGLEYKPDPVKEMQTEFESKIKKNLGFEVGHWVEHGGLVGVVDDIDTNAGKIRFIGYKVIGDTKPIEGNAQGWVNAKSAKAAPMETFKNANKLLIDLALDTKDYDWLEELTK